MPFTVSRDAEFTQGFRIAGAGEADGRIMTTDADGNVSWIDQPPTTDPNAVNTFTQILTMQAPFRVEMPIAGATTEITLDRNDITAIGTGKAQICFRETETISGTPTDEFIIGTKQNSTSLVIKPDNTNGLEVSNTGQVKMFQAPILTAIGAATGKVWTCLGGNGLGNWADPQGAMIDEANTWTAKQTFSVAPILTATGAADGKLWTCTDTAGNGNWETITYGDTSTANTWTTSQTFNGGSDTFVNSTASGNSVMTLGNGTNTGFNQLLVDSRASTVGSYPQIMLAQGGTDKYEFVYKESEGTQTNPHMRIGSPSWATGGPAIIMRRSADAGGDDAIVYSAATSHTFTGGDVSINGSLSATSATFSSAPILTATGAADGKIWTCTDASGNGNWEDAPAGGAALGDSNTWTANQSFVTSGGTTLSIGNGGSGTHKLTLNSATVSLDQKIEFLSSNANRYAISHADEVLTMEATNYSNVYFELQGSNNRSQVRGGMISLHHGTAGVHAVFVGGYYGQASGKSSLFIYPGSNQEGQLAWYQGGTEQFKISNSADNGPLTFSSDTADAFSIAGNGTTTFSAAPILSATGAADGKIWTCTDASGNGNWEDLSAPSLDVTNTWTKVQFFNPSDSGGFDGIRLGGDASGWASMSLQGSSFNMIKMTNVGGTSDDYITMGNRSEGFTISKGNSNNLGWAQSVLRVPVGSNTVEFLNAPKIDIANASTGRVWTCTDADGNGDWQNLAAGAGLGDSNTWTGTNRFEDEVVAHGSSLANDIYNQSTNTAALQVYADAVSGSSNDDRQQSIGKYITCTGFNPNLLLARRDGTTHYGMMNQLGQLALYITSASSYATESTTSTIGVPYNILQYNPSGTFFWTARNETGTAQDLRFYLGGPSSGSSYIEFASGSPKWRSGVYTGGADPPYEIVSTDAGVGVSLEISQTTGVADFKYDPIFSENAATVGDVWTAQTTGGAGAWAAGVSLSTSNAWTASQSFPNSVSITGNGPELNIECPSGETTRVGYLRFKDGTSSRFSWQYFNLTNPVLLLTRDGVSGSSIRVESTGDLSFQKPTTVTASSATDTQLNIVAPTGQDSTISFKEATTEDFKIFYDSSADTLAITEDGGTGITLDNTGKATFGTAPILTATGAADGKIWTCTDASGNGNWEDAPAAGDVSSGSTNTFTADQTFAQLVTMDSPDLSSNEADFADDKGALFITADTPSGNTATDKLNAIGKHITCFGNKPNILLASAASSTHWALGTRQNILTMSMCRTGTTPVDGVSNPMLNTNEWLIATGALARYNGYVADGTRDNFRLILDCVTDGTAFVRLQHEGSIKWDFGNVSGGSAAPFEITSNDGGVGNTLEISQTTGVADFKYDPVFSENAATVGHVWTAQTTGGAGAWAAIPTGVSLAAENTWTAKQIFNSDICLTDPTANAIEFASVQEPTVTDFQFTHTPDDKLEFQFRRAGLITAIQSGNDGKIRITSADHGFFGNAPGFQLQISGVNGTTEANGTFGIDVINTDQLELQGTTFTNAYSGGGRWLQVTDGTVTDALSTAFALDPLNSPSFDKGLTVGLLPREDTVFRLQGGVDWTMGAYSNNSYLVIRDDTNGVNYLRFLPGEAPQFVNGAMDIGTRNNNDSNIRMRCSSGSLSSLRFMDDLTESVRFVQYASTDLFKLESLAPAAQDIFTVDYANGTMEFDVAPLMSHSYGVDLVSYTTALTSGQTLTYGNGTVTDPVAGNFVLSSGLAATNTVTIRGVALRTGDQVMLSDSYHGQITTLTPNATNSSAGFTVTISVSPASDITIFWQIIKANSTTTSGHSVA